MSEIVGYRNPATGVETYNAGTQTMIRNAPTTKFHRDAQTADLRSRKGQSTRESGTQMTRSDLIVFAGPFEQQIQPHDYRTSADVAERQAEAALTLQQRWRGYLGRAKAQQVRERKRRASKTSADRLQQEKETRETHRLHEINRRLHPKTKEDFRLVMADIKHWSEVHKAEPGVFRDTLRLVQQLDRLRVKANQLKQTGVVDDLLDQLTRPKLWTQKSTGTVTEVETPEISRNKELVQLYRLLEMATATKTEERMEILLKLKWEVKVFDSALTRELNDLIDREADMLNRKRPASSLGGLRKRMNWLFLQFISDPQFNPGAVINKSTPSSHVGKTLAGTINIIAHFAALKLNALAKNDKSSKAAIDIRISNLCNTINKLDSYCTLSSCSGRVYLYTSSPKKSEHSYVRYSESHDSLEIETLLNAEQIAPTVWLRFEPAILHVACLDLINAQKLLNLARYSFPVSGILTATGISEAQPVLARKIVVSLRQDGNLDLPVRISGRNLFDESTAGFLAEVTNKRFERCWSHIEKLEDELK